MIFAMLVAGCGGNTLVATTVADAARGDANRPDAGDNADASDEEGGLSCNDQLKVLQGAFHDFLVANQACAVDSDCSVITDVAACLPCAFLLRSPAAPRARDLAVRLCAPFDAQGCMVPPTFCPRSPTPVCDHGMCALAL